MSNIPTKLTRKSNASKTVLSVNTFIALALSRMTTYAPRTTPILKKYAINFC